MHENGPAHCGHRAEFRVSDARLGKLLFGTPDKSGLRGAGSLVYIFICVAGVLEGLRKKKSLKAPLHCKKRVRRRRFVPRFPHFRLRERRSWRRVDLSMRELRELIGICVGPQVQLWKVTQVQLWKVTQVQIWKVTHVQLWKVTQVQLWKVTQVQLWKVMVQ